MLYETEVRAAQRKLSGRRSRLAAERPDPELPEGADRLPQIKHVVVLMMENHSYDNYFGMLADRGDGLTLGADGLPTELNYAADGTAVRMHALNGTVNNTTQLSAVPSQSWNASHIQWNDGQCDGFVRSVEDTLPGKDATVPMTYWTEAQLPFYYALARTFPLATRWFGSCLGPTFPNRRFMIAGTAHGLIDDSPYDLLDYPPAGTIFDLLTEHGISWINYHQVTGDQSRWRHYARHTRKMTRRRLRSAVRAVPAMSQGVQK